MNVGISSEAFDWKAAWYALDEEHRAQAERIKELETENAEREKMAQALSNIDGVRNLVVKTRNDALREAARTVSENGGVNYMENGHYKWRLRTNHELAGLVASLIEGATND